MTRFENEWPLARTQYTKLFLDATNGTLGARAPEQPAQVSYEARGKDGELYGPQFKITFDRDTELTGYMKLKLWVSAEGADDLDLFVGVKKFDRRGKEVNFPDLNHIEHGHVATGWLRVSHRELDEVRSTPWQPWLKHERLLKLCPGEIVPVEVEILPSGTLFRKGESLVLLVQGSEILLIVQTAWPINEGQSLPRVRCMHTDTVNQGKHVIHTGGKYDSHLLVPVIPGQ